MTNTTATTYRNGQITVENGLTIKIEVQHEVTVADDGDNIVISRIIRKYKQSGTGWRYNPFFEEVESVLRMSRCEAPNLVRDLMWAMAIGAEERTTARLS